MVVFINMTIIKQNNMTYQDKVVFTFGTGMDMGLGWVPIYPLPVPYPYFEIGENSYPYPNPVKTEKIRQIEFGSDG